MLDENCTNMKIPVFAGVTCVVGQNFAYVAENVGASPTSETFYPKTQQNIQEEIFSSSM
jgi:hypothetical protein